MKNMTYFDHIEVKPFMTWLQILDAYIWPNNDGEKVRLSNVLLLLKWLCRSGHRISLTFIFRFPLNLTYPWIFIKTFLNHYILKSNSNKTSLSLISPPSLWMWQHRFLTQCLFYLLSLVFAFLCNVECMK
jgi:hypothetical protein